MARGRDRGGGGWRVEGGVLGLGLYTILCWVCYVRAAFHSFDMEEVHAQVAYWSRSVASDS